MAQYQQIQKHLCVGTQDEKQPSFSSLERARLVLSKLKYSDSKILRIKEAAEKLPDNITILIGRNDNEQFNSKLT